MPTLVMFWDEVNHFGDSIAGMRIENNVEGIVIPTNACGFRLQRPDSLWNDYWYFAEPGPGSIFEFQGITYSSGFAGNDNFVQSQGPVGGCAGGSGSYNFITTLGAFGINEDDPVLAGAGSFIADFTSADDITWLDSAGKVIELKFPDSEVPPPKLPREFFEAPPEVKGCFRDFEGKLHCPEDTDSAGQSAGNLPSGGVALFSFSARNAYIVPGMEAAEDIAATPASVASGQPLEIRCPAELRLTVRFIKSASAAPGRVRYRFLFAHGPRSTVFERVVSDAGLTTVNHSVPIPLPKPVGSPPNGGVDLTGPDDFSVFLPPIDPPPSDPSGPGNGSLTIEPLPDNEHKGAVRVEVLNSVSGIIASGWANYHLICEVGSGRPVVTPGLVGAGIVSLQSNLNRWIEMRSRPTLNLDGRFGKETARVVMDFQNSEGLADDGIVGPKTWRALLKRVAARPEMPDCKPKKTGYDPS